MNVNQKICRRGEKSCSRRGKRSGLKKSSRSRLRAPSKKGAVLSDEILRRGEGRESLGRPRGGNEKARRSKGLLHLAKRKGGADRPE